MIHLYNPENDVALANNLERFTLAKGAAAIRNAGSYLPMFWAEKDDYILAHSEIDSAMAHYKQRYNLLGEGISIVPSGHTFAPWGWSKHARMEFLLAGADDSSLPDDSTLEKLRQLSHRRTSIEINRAIGVNEKMLAIEAFTAEHAKETVARFGNAVIKLPWSSSGRGVIYSSQITPENFDNYVGGMIARQGSVTIEPRLERIQDFATLFFSNGESVEYRGISIFATNHAGFYEGNIVEPQHLLAKKLNFDINSLSNNLVQILTKLIIPHYRGWLGIDMMTYRKPNGSIEIAPCIEMNLRMTMGVAAMSAAEKVFAVEKAPMLLKVTPLSVSLERM